MSAVRAQQMQAAQAAQVATQQANAAASQGGLARAAVVPSQELSAAAQQAALAARQEQLARQEQQKKTNELMGALFKSPVPSFRGELRRKTFCWSCTLYESYCTVSASTVVLAMSSLQWLTLSLPVKGNIQCLTLLLIHSVSLCC